MLILQVLNAAWDACIPVTGENSIPCHSREGYNRILENSKPLNDPDGRHLLSFAYDRLSPQLMDRNNLIEFERFVKRMHGETTMCLLLSFYFVYCYFDEIPVIFPFLAVPQSNLPVRQSVKQLKSHCD